MRIHAIEGLTLKGHVDDVFSVAYSPNGKYLANGSGDKTTRIWDAKPKSETFGKSLQIMNKQINCMGMNIKGVSGLDKEEIKFLKERGATDSRTCQKKNSIILCI